MVDRTVRDTRERDHPERGNRDQGTRDNKSSQSVLHLLHRAGQAADELFIEAIQGAEVTPRQFAVLVAVANQEALNQTEIVEATGIDRSTLADIVKRLVKRGLLARRRSKEDARANSVNLTAAGRSMVRETTIVASRIEKKILNALTPAEREMVHAMLMAIVGLKPSVRASERR